MKISIGLFFLLHVSLNCFSQTIVKQSLSSCDKNSNPEFLRNRIVSKEIINDTLHLKIGFKGQCALDVQAKLVASNDSLSLVLLDTSDVYAFCYCCYELHLTITGVPNENFVLVYPHHYTFYNQNGEETDTLVNEVLTEQSNKFFYPLEHQFRNIEVYTQRNAEGLRTGVWYTYDTTKVGLKDLLVLKSAAFFAPPEAGKEKVLWTVQFKEDGTVKNVSVYIPYDDSWAEIEGSNYYRLIGKTE